MSDYITGELVRVGTYSEAEQPFGETSLACAVVCMDREQLKVVRALPMYDRVAIIRTAELEQLERDHADLEAHAERVNDGNDLLTIENDVLRNEIARLKGQTMWVCACGGTDCNGIEENAKLRSNLMAAESEIIALREHREELRNALAESEEFARTQGEAAVVKVRELMAENAELIKHRIRLEWLIQHAPIDFLTLLPSRTHAAYEVIDRAMEAE